jgi:hypothetical protein
MARTAASEGSAALVVQHGLTLYARDSHFDHLPQIDRL